MQHGAPHPVRVATQVRPARLKDVEDQEGRWRHVRHMRPGEPALPRGEVEPVATAHHQLAVEHNVAEPHIERFDHLREEPGERA